MHSEIAFTGERMRTCIRKDGKEIWLQAKKECNVTRPQNRSKFCFFSFRKSFAGNPREFHRRVLLFRYGRSGLPTLCISAMILVALQNNS